MKANKIRVLNGKAISRLRSLGYKRKLKLSSEQGEMIFERLLKANAKPKTLRLTFYPTFQDIKVEWQCETKRIGPLSMASVMPFADVLKNDKTAERTLLKAIA